MLPPLDHRDAPTDEYGFTLTTMARFECWDHCRGHINMNAEEYRLHRRMIHGGEVPATEEVTGP